MSNEYIEPTTLEDKVIGRIIMTRDGRMQNIVTNAWGYREYLLFTDEKDVIRPPKQNSGNYKYAMKYPVMDGGILRCKNDDIVQRIVMDKIKKSCNICTSRCKRQEVCGLFNTLLSKELTEE